MIRTRTIDRYEGFRALSTCVVRSALFHHIGKRLVTASAAQRASETRDVSMLRRKAVSHVGRGLTSAVLQARSNCSLLLYSNACARWT